MARAQARGTGRAGRASRAERMIFGVPERFMRPRLFLIATVVILVGFGLLMVYSASSVTALASTGDAAYYLKRQALFALVGAAAAVFLAVVDYHVWLRLIVPVWAVTVLLLLIVIVAGTDNDQGANRWIDLGFFDLQPSEFAKISIVFTAAAIAERYYEEGTIDGRTFLTLLGMGVALPVALILIQPDKGTTLILGCTLIVLGYLSGVPKRILAVLFVAGVVAFFALSMKDEYSRVRLLAMLDPWKYLYEQGWQLVQGFYAFASGGLFGVGIGFSRQKYTWLPLAHNDFIFAVVGEECGFLGAVGMLAGFAVFLWAGLKIAQHAPDLAGRLVAAGCSALVIVQLLVNVCGVVGIFPMTGKPVPFISYGGSSILASLMLVGVIASVSIHSRLPETAYDRERRSWQVEESAPAPEGRGLSFAGEPRPRSERASGPRAGSLGSATSAPRRSLTMVEGGTRGRRGGVDAGRGAGPGGQRRIDLGPSAADRLRSRRGR